MTDRCTSCGQIYRHARNCAHYKGNAMTEKTEKQDEAREQNACPRCGALTCNDPDSKECSDNCITRHRHELSAANAALAEERAARERAEQSWKCFHCGEVFTDEKEAADHFGTDQYEYSQPGCVERLSKDEKALRHEIVLAGEEVQKARREVEEAEIDRDNLAAMESELARRFEGARSVGHAWNVLDSMTGHYLAEKERAERAEAELAKVRAEKEELVSAVNTFNLLKIREERDALANEVKRLMDKYEAAI